MALPLKRFYAVVIAGIQSRLTGLSATFAAASLSKRKSKLRSLILCRKVKLEPIRWHRFCPVCKTALESEDEFCSHCEVAEDPLQVLGRWKCVQWKWRWCSWGKVKWEFQEYDKLIVYERQTSKT
jgi:hypothetical protein